VLFVHRAVPFELVFARASGCELQPPPRFIENLARINGNTPDGLPPSAATPSRASCARVRQAVLLIFDKLPAIRSSSESSFHDRQIIDDVWPAKGRVRLQEPPPLDHVLNQ